MAPARRRALHEQQNLTVQQSEQVTAHIPQDVVGNQDVEAELFIDPMLGIPLAIYIDKDVNDRDELAELVTVSQRVNNGRILKWERRGGLETNAGPFVKQKARSVATMATPCISDLCELRRKLRCHDGISEQRKLTGFLQKYGGIVSPGYSSVPYVLGSGS